MNAIDLATRMRDRGHDVRVYAPPGELQSIIAGRGLVYRAAPAFAGDSLRPRVVSAMAAEIRDFRPDIVHTYEASPSLVSAAVAARVPHRNVTTVMSMAVPDFIPDCVPLFVGTKGLLDGLPPRPGPVHLMEPPIDTAHDQPGDVATARRSLGLRDSDFVISVVGRLSREHQKARGVAAAIAELGSAIDAAGPAVLLVAGAGDDEQSVRDAAAAAVNTGLDVRLLGNVEDPRDVYDAADVVFGMGGSALRALAHAKPLIVQGADGFWRLLTPESAELFFETGFFGAGAAVVPFSTIIAALRDDADERARLAEYGRMLVEKRFSLDVAADQLERVYRDTAEGGGGYPIRSVVGSLARYARFRVAMRAPAVRTAYRRVVGRHD
ncbi:glycosyltransferase family 4 protein [Microbacterium sp. NPDC057650]|uniref:glycosyltransferase family 4 protein n=1 Tax=unclassified Microbacterium TaxID=2609290 RepID=UPI0036720AFD